MKKNIRPIQRINFTRQGLHDLMRKRDTLIERRPAAVLELKRAREMGDLSENGLYKAARAALSGIDANLRRMEAMIKVADVKEAPKDTIGIGSKVLVEQNGREVEYRIVGDFEARPLEKKISAFSPIGAALIGKKSGETTSLETPGGVASIKIIKIS